MDLAQLLGKLDVFPGAKTFITLLVALGMMVCQMRGYHTFSNEAWGIVGINGLIFYKLGQDRKANGGE